MDRGGKVAYTEELFKRKLQRLFRAETIGQR